MLGRRFTLLLVTALFTGLLVFHGAQNSTYAKVADEIVIAASPEEGSWGPHRLRGMNGYGSYTLEDFQLLKSWGANVIRYQIVQPRIVYSNGSWTFDMWTWGSIEHILNMARQVGLRVILDFHAHGQFFPAELWEPKALDAWTDPENRAKFADLWRSIATRYKDDRDVIAAYEILNEPHPPRTDVGWAALNSLSKEVTEAIRSVDGWHTIIVSGPNFSRPAWIDRLEPTGDPNTVYTFHMYEPTEFTHQGLAFMNAPFGYSYPGIVPLGWDDKVPTMVDRDWVIESMAPVVEFQQQHNVRIFVGEFGARRHAPNNSAYVWLKDVLEYFEEQGWDWAYHVFFRDPGADPQWSAEHNNIESDRQRYETTDRLELLKSWFALNHHMASVE